MVEFTNSGNALDAYLLENRFSKDVKEINLAMMQARKEFKVTGKSGYHVYAKFKYAELDQIYEAVEEALNKYDMMLWHNAVGLSYGNYLFTRIIHLPSGQYVEDMRALIPDKAEDNKAQNAANTHMRKVAILSLCAIHPEEDDEGQAIDKEKREAKLKPKQEPVKMNELDYKDLMSYISQFKDPKGMASQIKERFEVKKWVDVEHSKYLKIIDFTTAALSKEKNG